MVQPGTTQGQVVVCAARIDRSDAPWRDVPLSELEQRTAARLRRTSDRDRYVAAHRWLRAVLGAATGNDPAGLRFVDGSGRGKPSVPQLPGLEFSFSRADELVGVAFGLGTGPLGFDVETRSRVVSAGAAGLADLFSARERAAVTAAHDPVDRTGRAWVRKEAAGKYTGRGVDPTMLGSAEVLDVPGPDASSLRVVLDGQPVWLVDCPVVGADGWAADGWATVATGWPGAVADRGADDLLGTWSVIEPTAGW